MKQHEIIKSLHSFFSDKKNEPFIDLAYIFGSRADGKVGPISIYEAGKRLDESKSVKWKTK